MSMDLCHQEKFTQISQHLFGWDHSTLYRKTLVKSHLFKSKHLRAVTMVGYYDASYNGLYLVVLVCIVLIRQPNFT